SGLNVHLRADASVINKGQATEGESATDIDGDPRGSVTDYGADEFVNRAPIAALTGPAGTVREGRAVTFDASKSFDPEAAIGGGVVAYHWEFGDGTSADTTTPTTAHTFSERKQFPVTVTVTDKQGLASAASSPVTVSVLDGTPPTVTIGQPAAKQRLNLYKRNKPRRRARVTLFGNAADDTALATVYLALRPVASEDGQCRWFNGKAKLVAAPCTQPTLLTATVTGGSWQYRLPLKARLPRGAYRLIAVAVDSSGLSGEPRTVRFRFR
ncbi:MAG: PKD domain-containing protein, partial [Solirubrobacteraceae bacterium]